MLNPFNIRPTTSFLHLSFTFKWRGDDCDLKCGLEYFADELQRAWYFWVSLIRVDILGGHVKVVSPIFLFWAVLSSY